MSVPDNGHDRASGGDQAAGVSAGALPVLAEEARVVHLEMVSGEVLPARQGPTLPAVQAAAAAAGGFVAGVAVVGLVTRRQRRSSALARGRRAGRGLGRGARRGRGGAGEIVQIVGSRSLLLDVHLLGGRD
ncbi:MAG TPA: hypothetical protein VG188_01580 [Solirubrobacteraceae bacterium]|jgi:hypothetical protein|nr:hypothetical protein [Solirubrobacteraceae bacterium]